MSHHDPSCHELLASLSEYVDGELSKDICAEIEKHLNECSDCKIVVDTLRKTIDLYHTNSEGNQVPTAVMHRLYFRLNIDDFLTR